MVLFLLLITSIDKSLYSKVSEIVLEQNEELHEFLISSKWQETRKKFIPLFGIYHYTKIEKK